MSFFTAHALAEGLDPEALLHEAWVERVTLPLLRSEGSNALLSFDELRARLPEVLDPEGPGKPDDDAIGFQQSRAIAMHIQLTGLRGLTYPIRGLRRDAPISATTYADWGRFRIEPGGGLEQIATPDRRSPARLRAGLSRQPRRLRTAAPRPRRGRGGVRAPRVSTSFPKSGHLWYTDGGMLGSQPLGRVISAGRELHGGGEDSTGVHLLVDPRSENASLDVWSDPDEEPSWQEGASRALAILSEQSLFDDMRKIEKDNSKLESANALADPPVGESERRRRRAPAGVRRAGRR